MTNAFSGLMRIISSSRTVRTRVTRLSRARNAVALKHLIRVWQDLIRAEIGIVAEVEVRRNLDEKLAQTNL